MTRLSIIPQSAQEVADMLEKLPEKYRLLAKGVVIGISAANGTDKPETENGKED